MDIVAHRIVGNASSLPPRLPLLSPVLRMLRDSDVGGPVSYTMVCLSYRGYVSLCFRTHSPFKLSLEEFESQGVS